MYPFQVHKVTFQYLALPVLDNDPSADIPNQ
jgi:hypothetical protein